MTLKSDVSLLKLVPQCLLGMWLAEAVFARLGFPLTVTSIYRGGSGQLLHAEGRAFDIRVRSPADPQEIPQSKWPMLTQELKKVLGPLGFDVILENPNNDPMPPAKVASHIHIEYDPKDSSGNKLWPIGTSGATPNQQT